MDTTHVVCISVQAQKLETMSIHTSELLTTCTLPLVTQPAARAERGLSDSWYTTFNRICHMSPVRHSCVKWLAAMAA